METIALNVNRKSMFVYIFLFWSRQLLIFRAKIFLKNRKASFRVIAVVNLGPMFPNFHVQYILDFPHLSATDCKRINHLRLEI